MVRTACLVLLGSLFLLASCKEKEPTVYFGAVSKGTDTAYLSAVEASVPRRVLIEEFTGVKCPNCPAGQALLRNLDAQYAGNLSTISYQIFGNLQTEPLAGETRTDNRSQKATVLGTTLLGGVPYLPAAAFDRVPAAGAMLNNRTAWSDALRARVGLVSPINLTLTPSYDSTTHQLTLKVRVAYTKDVAGKQRLTLAFIESGIVDAQESTDTVYAEYDHEHVFRDFLTATEGDAFLDTMATKKAGWVYERRYVYLVNKDWKAGKCALVAFVQSAEGDSKEIYQSAEKALY